MTSTLRKQKDECRAHLTFESPEPHRMTPSKLGLGLSTSVCLSLETPLQMWPEICPKEILDPVALTILTTTV